MRACLLCLEGAPRVRVHACACVLWCFCPRLAQGPGGRCLQTGGLLLGRPEGPRGQRGVGGMPVESLTAGPFISDRVLALGGMTGTPWELGAFLRGVAAPWTASVA